jgi:hypothetical protein
MTISLKSASVALVALSIATPITASAATIVTTFHPGDTAFQTAGDTTPPITGPVVATIGRAGIAPGTYTDKYDFIVDANGTGFGTFSSTLTGVSGVDFTSATFNGKTVTITDTPLGGGNVFQFGMAGPVGILAGGANELVINFTVAALGNYGGTSR